MKILYCGDVVGRSGRDAIAKYIPRLRQEWALDFVIVNGENAAHGFGITKGICKDFYDLGVDAITTGNHVWDQKEILSYIDQDKRLLRPINYPRTAPGRGYTILPTVNGQEILVINAMARLFMEPLDDPFQAVDEIISKYPLGGKIAATIIDFHGEASSEKMAMGYFCDGRASLVVGTHTHVPTADGRILPKGTAYQTDAGMCGDYNSIIGMEIHVPIARFTRKLPTDRLAPSLGEATLCGVYLETDDATGLALKVSAVRMGPHLVEAGPN